MMAKYFVMHFTKFSSKFTEMHKFAAEYPPILHLSYFKFFYPNHLRFWYFHSNIRFFALYVALALAVTAVHEVLFLCLNKQTKKPT